MTQQVTRKPTEIQQATVCRCTDKATHEVFYVVKSDSQEGVWYQVRWNQQALRWQCNCPAVKPCKHERAVNEVLLERRARIASQMGGEVPAIVARMQAEEDSRLQSTQAQASTLTDAQFSQLLASQKEETETIRKAQSREAYCTQFDIY